MRVRPRSLSEVMRPLPHEEDAAEVAPEDWPPLEDARPSRDVQARAKAIEAMTRTGGWGIVEEAVKAQYDAAHRLALGADLNRAETALRDLAYARGRADALAWVLNLPSDLAEAARLAEAREEASPSGPEWEEAEAHGGFDDDAAAPPRVYLGV